MCKDRKRLIFDTLHHQCDVLIKQKKSYIYFMVLLETVSAGIYPFIMLNASSRVINQLVGRESKTVIIATVLGLFICMFILMSISLMCNSIFDSTFVELRMNELKRVFKRYQDLDYKYLEDSNFRNNIENAMESLSSPIGFEGVYRSFIKLCTHGFLILIYCSKLFLLSPALVIVCSLNFAVSTIVNTKVAKYIEERQLDRAKASRQKNYFNNVGYDFAYGKDIRVFELSKELMDQYKNKSKVYTQVINDIEKKGVKLGGCISLGNFVQLVVSLYIIINQYIAGYLNIGEVSLYIGIILSLSSTLSLASSAFGDFIENTVYVSNYFGFMSSTEIVNTYGDRSAISKGTPICIQFKNVWFKYPETENWILKNFNLTIEKGQSIAIVGLNGEGKSTIVKLLSRLFVVTDGEILLNGININEFSVEEYNKMIATVFQDVNIYACSILENILGENDSSLEKEKVIRSLRKLGLANTIEAFKEQYHTQMLKVIEDDGIELSGGQNQKIAIARAVYKDASIVILDEPTAAIDALAEEEIYQEFNSLTKNKSALYISHRLSTTKFCDKIAVISNGELAEYGTHDELMTSRGVYYNMFQEQGKYYKEGVDYEQKYG